VLGLTTNKGEKLYYPVQAARPSHPGLRRVAALQFTPLRLPVGWLLAPGVDALGANNLSGALMLRESRFRFPRPIAAALFAFACLALLPRGAAAQDANGFIANLGNQAIQVLGPSVPPAQRAAHFRQIFANDFDLHGASQFVLGPTGRSLSPEQQQEFQTLFREYLAQAYSARLAQYAGEPFQVTGSRPNGEEMIVTSQVQRRSGNPIEIDWHVINHGGRFLVTDVYVDGVSMKVTHRQEFASIIQRNGGRPEALLAALRQQLHEGPAPKSGSSYQPAPPAGR
jgi:phospholipid transport system substrate-binding protein